MIIPEVGMTVYTVCINDFYAYAQVGTIASVHLEYQAVTTYGLEMPDGKKVDGLTPDMMWSTPQEAQEKADLLNAGELLEKRKMWVERGLPAIQRFNGLRQDK